MGTLEKSSGMLLSVKLNAKKMANPFHLGLDRRQLKALQAGMEKSLVKQITLRRLQEMKLKEEI